MDYFHEKLAFPPWEKSVPQRIENDYKFFSMTQKVQKIDVMLYTMTKNPKIYTKIFLVTVLEN